jgi:hypothetical protein
MTTMSGQSRRKRAPSPESARSGLVSALLVPVLVSLPLTDDGDDADREHHPSPGEGARPDSNSPAWAFWICAVLSRGSA